MKKIATLILLAALAFQAQAQNPRVWLDTDVGPIIIELDPAAAPITVDNFLQYVNDGFYDGLIFHRVAEGFVIQGGGFDSNREFREPTYDPIVNEADNGLSNLTGTVAMARGASPDSASSQFFINLDDNTFLDPGEQTEAGYAVFGKVVFGQPTVDTIGSLEAIDATNTFDQRFAALHEFPFSPPLIRRAIQVDGFPLMPDHSGSWFDPDNGGVGFNVEIANDASGQGPIAIVYWYNFAEGAQFWLTGQANFEYGDSEVTVDLFSAESGTFQNAESEFEDYGTLTLQFDGCDTGTFSYDMPGFGSGDIDVTRLSTPEGYRCESL
ncbi:MAG: peptidylprolyl isomerase [Wenzhouxiangella sp.]|jgi:cyclophilin family peptidyl-prolyl cis-trans isomerase|nr:peptidylprolyl isomerase [Wenzhouxiangella sp.]